MMALEPLVSVCVPLYNAAPFLPETLDRLLGQSYRRLEIIVVDNCSTDGSREIAEQYAERDPRVRVLCNRYNVGYAGNLDKAASLASGELMMVHCADDTSEPHAIARMVEVFQRADVDWTRTLVMTDIFVIQQGGVRTHVQTRRADSFRNIAMEIGKYQPPPDLDRFQGGAALAEALQGLKMLGFLGAMMYPRSLWQAVEGVRSTRIYNPDKQYTYKLLAQNPEVIWIHEPLFSLRLHGENQTAVERSQGAIKQSLDDYVYTFERGDGELARLGVARQSMIATFVQEACVDKALRGLIGGSSVLALRYLCFALATYPAVALRSRRFYAAAMCALTGPIGQWLARAAYRLHKRRAVKVSA